MQQSINISKMSSHDGGALAPTISADEHQAKIFNGGTGDSRGEDGLIM